MGWEKKSNGKPKLIKFSRGYLEHNVDLQWQLQGSGGNEEGQGGR